MMTTREQLIDSAMRNLYQFGYNRFSFAHVAKDCGIAKASIHYHFPSKDTLVLAAIDKYTNDQKEFLESLKHNNQLDTLEKFEKMFDHAYERMKAKNYIGCLAGNLGLEISETNQTILTRINEFMNYKLTWFVDLIETGKKSGLLRKNAGTQRIAQSLITSLEGGIVTSKISKSPVMLSSALSVCRSIVKNELVIPD